MIRRIAQILWAIGCALIIGGIGLYVMQQNVAAGFVLGSGLVMVGLNTLIGGELIVGGEPRPYTVRGPVVRGRLEAQTNLTDVAVGQCGPDRVASVVYGPSGKPGFEVVDGVAYLRLSQNLTQLAIAGWRADLAGNVLWDIDAQSFLGDLRMDLSSLRLDSISIRTVLGQIAVTCPAKGFTRLALKSTFGRIEVRIPPQLGARINIKTGWLSHTDIRNERLTMIRANRLSTLDFDSASAQIEIGVETLAGDVILS